MAFEWHFEQAAEALLPIVTTRLTERGFQVQWTFDLQTARKLGPGCTCPDHDTTRCDCEYLVLLVKGPGREKQNTILLHGHERHSWIVLAGPPGRYPDDRIRAILATLNSVTPDRQLLEPVHVT